MKTTSIFFIFVSCMTSSLTASDLNQKVSDIVDKAKNALYSVTQKMTGPRQEWIDRHPGASVCLRSQSEYTSKTCSDDTIHTTFNTLGSDITNLVKKERLKTHMQFLKAYHTQHPYVLYGIGFVCALSIAHSVYTVINKMRKKDPQS